MDTLEEKVATYRDVRKNTTLWGSIHTGLAFALAVFAGIAGDSKTAGSAVVLALAIVAISTAVVVFTAVKLKTMESKEETTV